MDLLFFEILNNRLDNGTMEKQPVYCLKKARLGMDNPLSWADDFKSLCLL